MLKILSAFLFCLSVSFAMAPFSWSADKLRFAVVSSYHPEYIWSQETNTGFCRAMRDLGYFESEDQSQLYTENDTIETATVIVKKLWLDSKRKGSEDDLAHKTIALSQEIERFKPNLIFLGDDNAAKYIGNQFLNRGAPIVFWGVNNTPVKYGLVDSREKPGHNVTGVYQTGYYAEGLALLKLLAPSVQSFAILSDDTSSGRSHTKKIRHLAKKKVLPLTLDGISVTNNFEVWKSNALELQNKVDAFFIAQFSGLKDHTGQYISPENVIEWYHANITIPEVAVQGQFVKQGLLCSADDSGFNQAYEAVMIAHDILTNGKNPGEYPPLSPKPGPLMVNPTRLSQLKLSIPVDIAHKICSTDPLKLSR